MKRVLHSLDPTSERARVVHADEHVRITFVSEGRRALDAAAQEVPMNRTDVEGFVFGTYRHHRGDLYTAIALVTHHHTRKPMVLYVSHARGCVNCRPLHGYDSDPDGFCDPVTMIDGTSVPRFELMQEGRP